MHSILALLTSCVAAASPEFITDPGHPSLRALAKPVKIDETQYGCGPMLRPGRTYYVSIEGDDQADGLSWRTAWRRIRNSVAKLGPGDTLLIDEGEYYEGTCVAKRSGEPGRPIRAMAAPGCRVIITNAIKSPPLEKAPGLRVTYQTPIPAAELRKAGQRDIYESGSFIRLEDSGRRERVDEVPASFAYDGDKEMLYVQFSDGGPPGRRRIYWRRSVAGFSSLHSYWLVTGIRFRMCRYGVKMQRGGHNTVEDCEFFACSYHGVDFGAGAHRNLIRRNYGRQNTYKGLIQFHAGPGVDDNLMVGNRSDDNDPTQRNARPIGWCIDNYSGSQGRRNYIIGNVLNYVRSAKWKPPYPEALFQGNICVGTVYCTGSRQLLKPANRLVLRNNVILGPIAWAGEELGRRKVDWVAPDKAFVNNFWADGDAARTEAARFADPAWLDFRLQSDSPLRGKALDGGDRGAGYFAPPGRIFYVGPAGADTAVGTSARRAFRTFGKAAPSLLPGDTLYVMAGEYTEPLVLLSSGTASQPIRVRAYQKSRVVLPGIRVTGSFARVAGLTVRNARADGIEVRARGCHVEHCLVYGSRGAGVSAEQAPALCLTHCTLTRNRTAVSLRNASVSARLRNSVFASNREGPVVLDVTSRPGYRGYNNLHHGSAMEAEAVAREQDSLVAAPRFMDPAKHDFRLQPDSPAYWLGEFAQAAGSEERVPRKADIRDVRAIALRHDGAVVCWNTPTYDTTGEVSYRRKGETQWSVAPESNMGTLHAVGLPGLSPEADYEFRVVAKHFRGSDNESGPHTFRTPSRSREPLNVYVAPDGDDARDGLARDKAWRTLRKACLEAQAGDTVLIAPGTYHDPLEPVSSGRPDRPITFRRQGKGAVLLKDGGVDRMLIKLEGKRHIVYDGITFARTRQILKSYSFSIWLDDCQDIAFLNCRNSADPKTIGASFLVRRCSGIRLERNIFWRVRYYLQVADCKRFVIRNNTFSDHNTIGFMCWGWPEDSIIENNIFYNVRGYRNAYLWIKSATRGPLGCDHNLYLLPKNPKHGIGLLQTLKGDTVTNRLDARDLETWRRVSGLDAHSIEADPMFVDPDRGDFRLKPGSPAIAAGRDSADIGALGAAQNLEHKDGEKRR